MSTPLVPSFVPFSSYAGFEFDPADDPQEIAAMLTSMTDVVELEQPVRASEVGEVKPTNAELYALAGCLLTDDDVFAYYRAECGALLAISNCIDPCLDRHERVPEAEMHVIVIAPAKVPMSTALAYLLRVCHNFHATYDVPDYDRCPTALRALGLSPRGWTWGKLLRGIYASLDAEAKAIVDGDAIVFPKPLWDQMVPEQSGMVTL